MPTLNIRNMKDTFQESGDIFRNATYITINVVNMLQNALTQVKLQYRLLSKSRFLPGAKFANFCRDLMQNHFSLLPMHQNFILVIGF